MKRINKTFIEEIEQKGKTFKQVERTINHEHHMVGNKYFGKPERAKKEREVMQQKWIKISTVREMLKGKIILDRAAIEQLKQLTDELTETNNQLSKTIEEGKEKIKRHQEELNEAMRDFGSIH